MATSIFDSNTNYREKPYGHKKHSPDGGVGVHIGGGQYIASPNFKWSIKDKGYVRKFKSPAQTFDTSGLDTVQDRQTPDNPGLRYATASTYGVNIPVSLGQRFIGGNVIDASELRPVLVGYREYYTDVRIYPEQAVGPE